MKYAKKTIQQLNDLLLMNYEMETIYIEALENVHDDDLRAFFRERGFERNEFGKELRIEIEKLNGEPAELGKPGKNFYRIRMSFRNFLLLQNETELLNEVYKIKDLTIKAYDDLLIERSLPLSLCKLLVKHRDRVQDNLIAMIREKTFVA